MFHFGKISGFLLFLCLYVLVLYGVPVVILYNELSLEINLIFLIALIIVLFFFLPSIMSIANHSLLVVCVKLVSNFLFINFLVSFLADLIKRNRDYEHSSDDMTELLIIPITIAALIIWGWLLDRVYKYRR